MTDLRCGRNLERQAKQRGMRYVWCREGTLNHSQVVQAGELAQRQYKLRVTKVGDALENKSLDQRTGIKVLSR